MVDDVELDLSIWLVGLEDDALEDLLGLELDDISCIVEPGGGTSSTMTEELELDSST